MTFTQLEYVIAVDTWRHFATAAEHCFVTQPTLSMQIQKLEDELGVRIFDRSKQPVVPTEMGAEIITHSRKLLQQKELLQNLVQERKGQLSGLLKIAVIPTLAPYLLPLFVSGFHKKYPHVKLVVQEMMTESILTQLKEGRLDAAIMATPLMDSGLKEHFLFFEEFLIFTAPSHPLFNKDLVEVSDIDSNQLWLMKEGHCFRTQVLNFCELNQKCGTSLPFEFEAGSLETLKKLVEVQEGFTILPELSTLDMRKAEMNLVKRFTDPAPMREISLVVHRDFVKKRFIDALKQVIIEVLPDKLRRNKTDKAIPVKG